MNLRRALYASPLFLLVAYPLGCDSDTSDPPIDAGAAGVGGAAGKGASGGAAGSGGGRSGASGSGGATSAGAGGASGEAGEGSAAGAGGDGVGGIGGVGGPSGPTFTNPVHKVDFPDPFVLLEGGTYYAFSTNAGARHVRAARSSDLTTWEELPDALPELPKWAEPNPEYTLTWAPSVIKRGAQYVLFFTTRHQASGFQCIGTATSLVPEGPYDPSGTSKALVCQAAPPNFCGSIDPEPFYDATADKTYLLWKSDDNAPACNKDSRLWAQELSKFTDEFASDSSPVELLKRDQAWESPLVENPSMIFEGGKYYLFYSANWWESASYAVGYAECPNGPRAACVKKTISAPLFKSSGEALGPGGASFFFDATGRRFMAYHAWSAPDTSYPSGARSLRIEPVSFVAGAPVIAGPTTTPQPL